MTSSQIYAGSTEALQINERINIRNTGEGEAQSKKYKRLKHGSTEAKLAYT